MRFAYADPVYLGCSRLYPEHAESGIWDDLDTHRGLIEQMVDEFPDGWAMSLSTPSLRSILPLCPEDVRIAAWVKTFCAFKKGVRPAYAWEPVIYRGGRNPPRVKHPPPLKGGRQTTPKDFLAEPITLKKGLTGAKPERFCAWVLELLNYQYGDQLVDLFPGTGVMGRVVAQREGGGDEDPDEETTSGDEKDGPKRTDEATAPPHRRSPDADEIAQAEFCSEALVDGL